jgi:CheY-like chemotaxis protein
MNPTDTTPPTEPVTPPTEPVADAPAAPAVDPAPAAPTSEPAPAAESVAPAEPAAPTPAEPAAAPASPSNGTKRILLVEDDDSLAGVYVARLQAEGFDVRRVANGEEALATALSYKPDLALLDVMMPKVSGFDVLDIIRNTPETANLKIIMLTALSQESDLERAKQLGVDEYLIKSQVVIADVVDRIRAHLG